MKKSSLIPLAEWAAAKKIPQCLREVRRVARRIVGVKILGIPAQAGHGGRRPIILVPADSEYPEAKKRGFAGQTEAKAATDVVGSVEFQQADRRSVLRPLPASRNETKKNAKTAKQRDKNRT